MADEISTILVVDDEPMLRSVYRRWLGAAGYHVIEAATAREALLHVSAHRETISVVLTDLRMPGMSGEDLIAHLAASSPALPVIAMSGTQERPPSVPNDRFLEKPVSRERVLRAIAAAIDARTREH